MTDLHCTVSILTLGCPKNEVDSAKMESLIRGAGFGYVEDYTLADVVVVNTCAFIADATEQSIVTTLEVLDELGSDPNRHVIVAGCMASRYAADLRVEIPELDGVLPVEDEHRIVSLIREVLKVPDMGDEPRAYNDAPLTDLDDVEDRPELGPSAYVKIADGCDRECAFCAIPSFRGRYVSRPVDSIVREASALAAQGAREVVLIAQDTSAYGSDVETNPGARPSLASLIQAVAEVGDIRWVRAMYLQPNGVSDDLLAAMATEPKFVPYIEMPLQHASRHVLRAMHRPGRREEFGALIGRIRHALPDVVLRTTVMVGFPGETDADVDELISFLTEVEFDYVGVFIYSPEDGTVGATLPESVDPDVAAQRMQLVIDTCDPISWARASQRIGSTVDVLIEGFDPDECAYYGRHRGQAPDIDGTVLIPVEDPSSFTPAVGDIVAVRIVDSVLYDLIGEVA